MTFGTLPRRNPGLAAGATSLESPEFSVRASALTLSVRVYALATRTLPDEVLGSRGRFSGSLKSVPKTAQTEGSATIMPT